jgi:hypothetical protein
MEDNRMNRNGITALCWALLAGMFALGMTGCEDKEAQAEIERLESEAADLRIAADEARKRSKELEGSVQELRREVTELKMELKGSAGKLRIAEREVERMKKREESLQAAKERAPSRKEQEAAGKAAAEKHLEALVTIKGDVSEGKGFLVKADDKTWIYLAPGLLAGNSKLEVTQAGGGELEKFGAFQLAADAALARLEVLGEVDHALTVADAGELDSGAPLLGIGEDGEFTTGRSYGTEPKILKADSRFTSNALGSPVFDGATGDLLGIMLQGEGVKRELWPRTGGQNYAGRNVASRLNREITWNDSSIGGFLDEARAIADADRMTRLLSAFLAVPPGEGGLNFDVPVGGGITAKQLFSEHKDLSAVRSLADLDDWLRGSGARASTKDKNKKFASVYGEMGRTSKRDTAVFEARKFSSYHAEDAAQSLEWRKDAEEKLAAMVKGLEE